MGVSFITMTDAVKLNELIKAVRQADSELASYYTWRHPEPEVMEELRTKVTVAKANLDLFILSIEEVG
jgi:hypothetical protein